MSAHLARNAIRIGVLVPLVMAAMLLGPFGERVAAQTDISGTWNLTLLHPDAGGPIACSASIVQPGSTLAASMICTGLGSGDLSGSINGTTGVFTLSGPIDGYTMNMSGTAAADGNSMSGTFTIPPIPGQGTFSGMRKSGPLAVGGVAELAQVDLAQSSASRGNAGVWGVAAVRVASAVGITGALAVVILAAGAWQIRGRAKG